MPPKRLTPSSFLATGNAKVAAVLAVVALPILGLVTLNQQIAVYSRPYIIAAREAILGERDTYNRHVDAILSGRPVSWEDEARQQALKRAEMDPAKRNLFENVPHAVRQMEEEEMMKKQGKNQQMPK